jgi:hypothetical protein
LNCSLSQRGHAALNGPLLLDLPRLNAQPTLGVRRMKPAASMQMQRPSVCGIPVRERIRPCRAKWNDPVTSIQKANALEYAVKFGLKVETNGLFLGNCFVKLFGEALILLTTNRPDLIEA